jgi:hypothetical protein
MSLLDATVITIGSPGATHVSISITESEPKEGWLRGSVEVAAGPWRGECGAWFHMGELRTFATDVDRLYRELTGSVQFRPMEPYLELQLIGDGKGHIVVEGKAGDLASDGNHISFRFDVDQSELPAIVLACRSADPA